jgi:hypothetical protein
MDQINEPQLAARDHRLQQLLYYFASNWPIVSAHYGRNCDHADYS